MEQSPKQKKNERAAAEERTLLFWKEKDIFAKTLAKDAPEGEFVFYEGPPTANAKPALHHLEARVFKDAIPRYKTMQGFRVRRRAGWDTHGLPVELQIEKALGLASKKEIESYGIAAFNKQCKESVHTYIDEWKRFTERIGYWVDFDRGYYTYDPSYMESLWSILGTAAKRELLYKDYKVVPWCPRCGTGLSSHELAQGYQEVKDLSVYAKFKVAGEENTYFLAWTTTPWTLPGNVALAVGSDIEYVKVKSGGEILILAKERLSLIEEGEVAATMKGEALAGLSYEPLYPFLAGKLTDEQRATAFQVYTADFVTTSDGTGIVHTAVMYGQDDFELGTRAGLPKLHTVDESGHFLPDMDFLSGRFVKDEAVAVDIIKDLAHRGFLFKKEKYEHSYPHCWRCKTPLIYYARDSWYIAMSKLRDELVVQNESINWEPAHIKEGRFGEWLREVKDWALSRERYWGTPLPIWVSESGERIVVDSLDTLRRYIKRSGNSYFVMRHGETEHNVQGLWSCDSHAEDPLTERGRAQVQRAAEMLKGGTIDLIVASPFPRTQETAFLIAQELGLEKEQVIADARLGEWNIGSEFDQRPMEEYFAVRNKSADRYHFKTPGGESYADVFCRSAEVFYDLERRYEGKRILIVSHGAVVRALSLAAKGSTFKTMLAATRDFKNFDNAEVRSIDFVPLPHNENYELDLHRPYIDEIVLTKDGGEYRRVKEVMDVWFDSGAMPFAQDHYPFSNKEWIEGAGYPADFISEAIDQTRGWFYTLLAVGVLMERGAPYKNVICLGHLLDKDGKKMSKSIGNIVEPFEQIEKFGVDAVRFWMYSVNQPGESKNYDEKHIIEINNKVFNLLGNVLSFYELYRDKEIEAAAPKTAHAHVLDRWIVTRLHQLIALSTESLDAFDLFKPTRAIRDFIDDLSTWYLRRSRDRIKEGDGAAKATLYQVLKSISGILAPFAPFAAEDMWQRLRHEGDEESVHLSRWPQVEAGGVKDEAENVVEDMQAVRDCCAQGHMLRKKENIPVRQPLAALRVEPALLKVGGDYLQLVKEELNVKEVITGDAGSGVSLDTTITPELKAEGDYREFIRAVQDLRKANALLPSDAVILTLSPEAEALIAPFMDDFKKTVQAKEVRFAQNDGHEIVIGGARYTALLGS